MHQQRSFLVLGSGGREHALAWKLARSVDNPIVYVIPGNDGIAADSTIRGGCPSIPGSDFKALADFARNHAITLTVVGPEALLCAGVVDYFQQNNLPIFGPSKAAALLEASKAFSKEIMHAAGILTPHAEIFDDFSAAISYARRAKHPLVIKADGLAAGKGVVISHNVSTSEATLHAFLASRTLAHASRLVIIEQLIEGTETSFMVITDGNNIVTLPTSRDYKRVLSNDLGPNTGGMGAIAPAPQVNPALETHVIQHVIYPVLNELKRRGHAFCGFLYAGLMLDKDLTNVLEFNVRLGDPETQALVRAIPDDLDLGLILQNAAHGTLKNDRIPVANPAICVVMAARGYPDMPILGDTIHGLTDAAHTEGVKIFHAGTKARTNTEFTTAAGRVLNVTACATTLSRARQEAYAAVAKIHWNGVHYRHDVGRG